MVDDSRPPLVHSSVGVADAAAKRAEAIRQAMTRGFMAKEWMDGWMDGCVYAYVDG